MQQTISKTNRKQPPVNVNLKRFENCPTRSYEDASEASFFVATEIASLIKKRQEQGKLAVLGLATGSTPKKVYEYLIDMHRNEGLSFTNVVTFNLDEYYPMQPDSLHSYVRFMNEHLFDHIDIQPKNIHIPDGSISKDELTPFYNYYEKSIEAYGGIDIQLLGIGRTGHIGFNEPGSSITSKTRLVHLNRVTKLDAASGFFGFEHVPDLAITMGVGTILNARKIILMAWGEGKAAIIKDTVEGAIDDDVPATFLQHHPNCLFVLDRAAGALLTRNQTPWLVSNCVWNENLIKKAVIWLAEKQEKAISKLTDDDYLENSLADLITTFESADRVNQFVITLLQNTLNNQVIVNPQNKKTSLIFSPHPDDDVISMGGTLLQLADHGDDVHVAYQTSGNIAVFDDDVIRYLDFAAQITHKPKEVDRYDAVRNFLLKKKSGQVDTKLIQNYKELIRKGEALAACRYCNIPEKNAHFLNLPFYETGTVKKKPHAIEDVQITYNLLQRIKPNKIFAAGDLSDPHGTHRVCLQIVFEAIDKLKQDGVEWLKHCEVWLYRGAWQEWDIADIEMAVSLSPSHMKRKINAIYKHQSQKDKAMFPGNDEREFWQRAQERNIATAKKYNQLGLAEHKAIEGFVRHPF